MLLSTVKDNSSRANQAIILLWVTAFSLAIFTLSDLLIPVQAEGNEDSLIALAQFAVGLVMLGISILSAVYFLLWFRRAYANLKRAGRRIKHADGWAVGAWFVPFLNLFRPYTIMKEVWGGAHQLAYNTQPAHPVVRWWWLVFLLTSFMGRVTRTFYSYGDRQLENAAISDALHTVFAIVFILATISIIKTIAAAEEQLLLRQQVDAIGGPAPEPTSYYPDEETLAY